MNECPYCGAKMKSNGYAFAMGKRRLGVFHKVLAAGQEGIPSDKLMKEFGFESPTTLRTTVHYINQVIAPLIIRTRFNRLRVEEAPTPTD